MGSVRPLRVPARRGATTAGGRPGCERLVTVTSSARPIIRTTFRGSPVGAPWDSDQERSTLIWSTNRCTDPISGSRNLPRPAVEEIVMSTARTVYTMCGNGNRRFGPPRQGVSKSASRPARRQPSRQCQTDATSFRSWGCSAVFVDIYVVHRFVQMLCAAKDPCPAIVPVLERVTGIEPAWPCR